MAFPSFDLYIPSDLQDALKFLESEAENVSILARGTDLLPRIRKRQFHVRTLLDISGLEDDLRYIREENNIIHIGSLSTISDILSAELIGNRLEMIRQAGIKFGDPQIRNAATIGGNICSASSSEDFLPILLTLQASVRLKSIRGDRILPLESFILGKRVIARKQNEILTEVFFSRPKGDYWSGFQKMGRRNILIISLVSEAVLLTLANDLETIQDIKIALNRVTGRIPQRAVRTERVLVNRKATPELVTEAKSVLSSELNPKSDFRASGEYRREIAKVFLGRLLNVCSAHIRGT